MLNVVPSFFFCLRRLASLPRAIEDPAQPKGRRILAAAATAASVPRWTQAKLAEVDRIVELKFMLGVLCHQHN